MTAIELANAIIKRYGNTSYIINTKINNLVYLAYAHALQNGSVLFNDEIESRQCGVVIPAVYYELRKHKDMCIVSTTIPTTKQALQVAKELWTNYGYMTASDIKSFIQRGDGVWHAVYNGESTLIINKDILSSTDSIVLPTKEETRSYAMDKLIENNKTLLEMLENA